MSKAIRRVAFSICLLVACVALAAAQDARQVLQTSVGFNTLKNSTQMTAEKRAEVERLQKLAQEANAASKYGEALKHYYHAMSLLRNLEWTPTRALTAALTIKLDRALIEPAQSVRLQCGQLFSLDQPPSGKLTGTIALLKLTGDEPPIKIIETLEAVEPDLITHPLTVEVTAPEIEDGNYRLAVTFKTATGETVTKTTTVHLERGLAARVTAAKSRLTKIEAKLKADKRDALLQALPSIEYRLKLFELASAAEINFARLNFAEEVKEANAMLDALEAGRDPLAARRGDFRKAYRSPLDQMLQPYRIFVPSSYDATKPFPLIIALHGMGGDENSYFDGYGQGAFKREAEQRGYLVACPKGRQPASMYLGPAEQDVMDVIAEIKRDYRVNPDRIYLTGHSMGGFGTWSIAANHPTVFAALAPVAGGGNPANMAKIVHIAQHLSHAQCKEKHFAELSNRRFKYFVDSRSKCSAICTQELTVSPFFRTANLAA